MSATYTQASEAEGVIPVTASTATPASAPHSDNAGGIGRSQAVWGNAAIANAAVNGRLGEPATLLTRWTMPAAVANSAGQQVAGNSAMQHALRSGLIQAKLSVSEPGDRYEQEADRVAEQVVSSAKNFTIQRKCSACGGAGTCGCKQKTPEIQLKQNGSGAVDLAPETVAQIASLNGGGQPLARGLRDKLEPHFGEDFGDVRIHTDERAASLAKDIGARAFTTKQHIAFGAGEFAPESSEGQRLLAHELTHVVQQGATSELDHELPAETLGRSVMPVGPDHVQADWLDDAKEAAGSAYDSVSSTASSAYETVASGVSDAYDATKSAVGSVADQVVEGAKDAAKTVSETIQGVGSAISGIGDTVSSDPEETRANLISQVNATRGRVASADPETITAAPSQIAAINSHIGGLNVAMAGAAPAIPLLEPVAVGLGEAIGAALAAIAAAIGISVGALIIIIVVIVLAILALIYVLFFRDTKRFPDPVTDNPPKDKTDPKDKPEPREKPDPRPKPDDRPPPPIPGPRLKPDCCPGPTPRGSFKITDKRHPYFRPGVVEVKDNRNKHTANITPTIPGTTCTASFLLSVVSQDPSDFGPCIGAWIAAARSGARSYGSQMGSDTVVNYVDKVEDIILDKRNQVDATTWFGDTGETCGVNIAIPGAPVLTNNARIDNAPDKAHIIPEDQP